MSSVGMSSYGMRPRVMISHSTTPNDHCREGGREGGRREGKMEGGEGKEKGGRERGEKVIKEGLFKWKRQTEKVPYLEKVVVEAEERRGQHMTTDHV